MKPTRLTSLLHRPTLKDSVISIAGQVSAGLLGAVFFAIAARLLGVQDFGLFSLALATAIILKDIIDPGINAVLLRFVPAHRHTPQAASYIKYAALIKLGYFTLIIPPLLIFHRPLSLLIFKQPTLSLIPLTLALTLSLSLGFFISGIFQSHRRFLADAIFTISQPLLRLILLFGLYLTGSISVQALILTNLSAYLLVSLVALFALSLDFWKAHTPASVKTDTHGFLPPVILSTASNTLSDRVSLYLTNHFTSPFEVGILSSATQLFTPAKQIAGSLSNVLGTRFAAYKEPSQVLAYLRQSTALCLFLGLGLASTAIIAHPIVALVYGVDFLPAVPLFRLLAIAFGIFIFQVPFTSLLLYHHGRSDLLAKLSLVQLVLTFVANLYFLPRFGVIAAAYAFLTVMLINAALTVYLALAITRPKR